MKGKLKSIASASTRRKSTVAVLNARTTSGAAGNVAPPLALTHPGKVLDTESGLTKQALADYYMTVAERMLPHISHRPVSLVRCPDGTKKSCFFQKHATDSLPASFERVDIRDKKTGELQPYITLSTKEALAALAQIGVLEIHPWGSCNTSLETPDRIVFDLDPDAAIVWRQLADTALEIRKRLSDAGLRSFLKTTGGKGLHVVAPILPEHDWQVVKSFAHNVVVEMEKDIPSLYLTTMSKAARKDKIFLDYLRNERGATAVAPYSPRARPGVTVSLPLSWKELESDVAPRFTVAGFAGWKARLRRDPWKEMLTLRQRLS